MDSASEAESKSLSTQRRSQAVVADGPRHGESPQLGESPSVESAQERKLRIAKNRLIRKGRKATGETAEMTREERMMFQKVKNREAAQKSRDQRKTYIQSLEAENSVLKARLDSFGPADLPAHCPQCGHSLASGADSPAETFGELSRTSTDISCFLEEEPSEFIRVPNQSSFFGASFGSFVLIVALAITIAATGADPAEIHGRILLESGGVPKPTGQLEAPTLAPPANTLPAELPSLNRLANTPGDQKVFSGSTSNEPYPVASLGNRVGFEHRNEKGELQLAGNELEANGLVPWSHEGLSGDCLKKLLLRQKHAENGLVYLRDEPAESLMVCRMPLLYQPVKNSSGTARPASSEAAPLFSKIIDIIVSGAELLQIYRPEQSGFLLEKPSNLDGLYEIKAEVKSVLPVTDPSCLSTLFS